MADIQFSTIVPNDNFYPDFVSGGLVIPTDAAAGTILTVTPPAGKRVRLLLLTVITASTQPNISVAYNGIKRITNLSLSDSNTTASVGRFRIGVAGQFSSILFLDGKKDEVLTIIKEPPGATTQDILYTYAYGD